MRELSISILHLWEGRALDGSLEREPLRKSSSSSRKGCRGKPGPPFPWVGSLLEVEFTRCLVPSILLGQTPTEKSKRKGPAGPVVGTMGKVVLLLDIWESQKKACPQVAVIPIHCSQGPTSTHVLTVLVDLPLPGDSTKSKQTAHDCFHSACFQGSPMLHPWVMIFILFVAQ